MSDQADTVDAEDAGPSDAEHIFEALIGIVAGGVIWITMGEAVFDHLLLTILVALLVVGGIGWLAAAFFVRR